MARRIVRTLHVGDDRFQRRLVARLLETIDDFQFEIVCADSETKGIELFDAQGAELIIVDYQLKEGNGLHFLQELRRHDAHVPVIAVSGTAGAEIARELIECGADDFLEKKDLSGHILPASVRDVLTRSDAWRRLNRRASMDPIKK
jgi:two-component system, NarL family, sensor histidine kinase UhpB